MTAAYIITALAILVMGLYSIYHASKNEKNLKRIKVKVNDHPRHKR